MDSFQKQTYETFVVGADFSGTLADSETITGKTATAIDKNGDDATSVINTGSINEAGGIVTVRVQGGSEDMSPYKLTFRIETSASNKYELDIKMHVYEK